MVSFYWLYIGRRIHSQFQERGETQRMWQGIRAITNYRKTTHACDSDTSLLNALNNFYTQFEAQNDVMVTTCRHNNQGPCLASADVRKTLCRADPQKAPGPENVPGRVLRECAGRCSYWHLQPLPEHCFRSKVPQGHYHHSCAKEVFSVLPQWLPSCCTHTHHDKALWEAHRERPCCHQHWTHSPQLVNG